MELRLDNKTIPLNNEMMLEIRVAMLLRIQNLEEIIAVVKTLADCNPKYLEEKEATLEACRELSAALY
jgi:hypothetical protein